MAVGSIPNNPPVVPGYSTSGGVQSGGGTTAVNGPRATGETQGVRPPGGLSVSTAASEVSYSSPNLEGIDWDALSSDFQSVENLSLSITAIMVLLIDVMKEMRKGQREAWMDEAQNALQMGMNAADKMRESAAAKLAADVVTNAASIVTSAVSLSTSAASLRASSVSEKAIETKATQYFGPAKDMNGLAAPTDTPAATPKTPTLQTSTSEISLDAPGSSSASANSPQTTSSALSVEGTPEASAQNAPTTQTQTTPPTDAQTAAAKDVTPKTTGGSAEAAKEGDAPTATAKAVTASGKATSELDNQKARAQYVSQQRSLAQADFEQRANIAKSITEIGGSLAKMGASVGEYFAGAKQAESKEFEALGAYSSALMQAELEFANQMRDAIRSVIDTMKGAEQAKHQATQAIYNI